MSFEKFISELFSFDLFLIISLRNRVIITDEIIDKNEKFFDIEILLSSFSHCLKTNNILSFRISRITLCLFI